MVSRITVIYACVNAIWSARHKSCARWSKHYCIYNIMHGVYNVCIRMCIYFTYNVDDYRHIYILYTRTKLYISLHALVSIMRIQGKRWSDSNTRLFAKYHTGLLMWDKKDLRSVESGLIDALLCWQVADCNIAVWDSVRWTSYAEVNKKLRWAQSCSLFAGRILIEHVYALSYIMLCKK